MRYLALLSALCLACISLQAQVLRLENAVLVVEVNAADGTWSLKDKSGLASWPSQGRAKLAARLPEGAVQTSKAAADSLKLAWADGSAATWTLGDQGRCVELRFDGPAWKDVTVPGELLAVAPAEKGAVVVPAREGLLVPAGGKPFRRTFGASDYEGCHMNMLGLLKGGSALLVTWDDAYVFPELVREQPKGADALLRVNISLRRSARTVRLHPLGKGDVNALGEQYRRVAQAKGLAVTLTDKIARNAHLERLIGASNAKLWTCLARRMNEQSTKEESVEVKWTFDEAAQVAEHLARDLKIDRCLFMIGGWSEGGYDCRHPDNLPANPECGGNDALAAFVKRVQQAGFVACLHDNYQDMYRDAKSWDESVIEKKADGSLVAGGRWLGGRAYMVCAPKQLAMARRPQNLPEIRRLFGPWAYFIDCTYAVGPRECHDPKHPLDRNQDIAFKKQLSDYARGLFGIFGSECGREWAIPHSDFFEGLAGVSGRYYHNLKVEDLGATVIPFWEMVYHDCQIVFGKYGYRLENAGEFVAHHALCGRPLYYHSLGKHLYWKDEAGQKAPGGPGAAYVRSDGGWGEGLCLTDVFLKNTHELLGPLHAATARQRLTKFEFLGPAGLVRRSTFGQGDQRTVVTVNMGTSDAEVDSPRGGKVLLPAYGVVIDTPNFAGFYARRWGGVEFPDGALVTFCSADGRPLEQAAKIVAYHGFGKLPAGAKFASLKNVEFGKP
ncbi:MAG: hypothetical protein BWX88_03155 [Planctomycetes bacterium ADurb.Bin126]|nr:MAG: hypothetical protein BWX88_03155 [Planctomycetes bacterium ADurb.Bin126]HOD84777.1 glycoside hydrolase [Phycisphaerae bacterium]HQL75752.1 glycoside hydrolase [Phycisphaerae bacterium]